MTLSEMSVFFRKLVKFGAIALVILFIGKITWGWVADYWEKTHTPPPPPPNYALGFNIPPLKINLKNTNFSNTKIVLDTIDGRLPKVPTTLPIYQIPSPNVTLLSLDRAQALANSLGFTSPPEALSSTEYQWKDAASSRTLSLKTTDFNFTLIQDNPNPKRTINFDESSAIKDVQNFLKQRSLLPKDIEEGTPSARFIKIAENGVSPSFRDEANAVVVDLFRKPLQNKYPTLNLNPRESLIRAVVTLQRPAQDQTPISTVSELKYTYWNVDPERNGTYPLKSASLAWEEFKTNKSLVSVGKPPFNELSINDIKLAYLLTEDYQEFIRPIYVFSGKNKDKDGTKGDFISFLPAISSVAPVKK